MNEEMIDLAKHDLQAAQEYLNSNALASNLYSQMATAEALVSIASSLHLISLVAVKVSKALEENENYPSGVHLNIKDIRH